MGWGEGGAKRKHQGTESLGLGITGLLSESAGCATVVVMEGHVRAEHFRDRALPIKSVVRAQN